MKSIALITAGLTCNFCGKGFQSYPSANRKYCSQQCYHKEQKGKPSGNKGKGLQELITPKQLVHLYYQKKMSVQEIADYYKCGYGTIHRLMALYDIKRRLRSKALEIKNPGGFKTGYTPWNKGITYNNPKSKAYWNDPVNRKRQLKLIFEGFAKKPTSPEKFIINLCKKYGLPFQYCGDGSKIVGGKVPDFVDANDRKKIIEVFGRAFHDPEKAIFDVSWDRQYFGRMAYFSQLGYDCLILWDDELDDEEKIERKIRSFLND